MSTANNPLDALVDAIAEAVAVKLRGAMTAPTTERKLLNVKEAAEQMGCSPSSIRHMISSGSLPQRALKRFGRRVLIDREEFDRWLSAH